MGAGPPLGGRRRNVDGRIPGLMVGRSGATDRRVSEVDGGQCGARVAPVQPVPTKLEDVCDGSGGIAYHVYGTPRFVLQPDRDPFYIEIVLQEEIYDLHVEREPIYRQEREQRVCHIAAKRLEAALSIVHAAGDQSPEEEAGHGRDYSP